jgi:hypothetical protein
MSACLLSEAGNHYPVYHDGIFCRSKSGWHHGSSQPLVPYRDERFFLLRWKTNSTPEER